MSPPKMRKLPGRKLYRVTDPSGKVHAKGTTKKKAKAQIRLLKAVEHGFVPTGKKRKSK